MDIQNVSKWCHALSESRINVQEAHQTGRPSVISNVLLLSTEDTIRANKRLTMRKSNNTIPEVNMTILHELN